MATWTGLEAQLFILIVQKLNVEGEKALFTLYSITTYISVCQSSIVYKHLCKIIWWLTLSTVTLGTSLTTHLLYSSGNTECTVKNCSIETVDQQICSLVWKHKINKKRRNVERMSASHSLNPMNWKYLSWHSLWFYPWTRKTRQAKQGARFIPKSSLKHLKYAHPHVKQ